MGATLLKKITAKTVVGKVSEVVKGLGKDFKPNTLLFRVVGIATGIQTGESDYGEWVKLKGQFSAINHLTGEAFRSRSCMLPELASGDIEDAVVSEENDSVEFGVDITISPSDSATGYQYGVIPLLEANGDDPLTRLTQRVAASLEAPEEKPKKLKKGKK